MKRRAGFPEQSGANPDGKDRGKWLNSEAWWWSCQPWTVTASLLLLLPHVDSSLILLAGFGQQCRPTALMRSFMRRSIPSRDVGWVSGCAEDNMGDVGITVSCHVQKITCQVWDWRGFNFSTNRGGAIIGTHPRDLVTELDEAWARSWFSLPLVILFPFPFNRQSHGLLAVSHQTTVITQKSKLHVRGHLLPLERLRATEKGRRKIWPRGGAKGKHPPASTNFCVLLLKRKKLNQQNTDPNHSVRMAGLEGTGGKKNLDKRNDLR